MVRVSIIDDEPANQEAYRIHIEMEFLDAGKKGQVKVSAFEDVPSAADTPADLILVDISAVAPFNCNNVSHVYSPICKLAEARSGALIVIISAMSMSFMEEVKERCQAILPDINLKLIDSSLGWGELDKVIATLIN